MPKRLSRDERVTRDALFSAPLVSVPSPAPESDLVKITVYVRPEQNIKLERLRLARLEAGQRTDKSALVREALDLLA